MLAGVPDRRSRDDHEQRLLGAAWWHLHEPSLLRTGGSPVPEMTMAVAEDARGNGVGTALIEALASDAARQFSVLALNVHLRNPATHVYMRSGFRVAGKGWGWFGVAMAGELHA